MSGRIDVGLPRGEPDDEGRPTGCSPSAWPTVLEYHASIDPRIKAAIRHLLRRVSAVGILRLRSRQLSSQAACQLQRSSGDLERIDSGNLALESAGRIPQVNVSLQVQPELG